ncbi:alpha/beta-hydrolase [Periconia macrospinosa]|uniref:Alpha/beta-hydrolase n=1 Tax=Periconia macrospinosa TaxID=97972 RepID=A0A2V1DCZ8_9PLEO|nr:alpha/beta-hydrolase [Periconia macrospinosa]
MYSTRPTIVIISGGWHIPASYTKLATLLETQGYQVFIPHLPSNNGARPPTAALAEDTTYIRDFVSDLIAKNHTIAVIMHSYGGQVGTNALTGLPKATSSIMNNDDDDDGKKGGILHLIYLTAFAQRENRSMSDKVEEFGQSELMPLAFEFADDNTVISRDPKNLIVGPSSVPDDEVDEYVGTMVRWNAKCMYDRGRVEKAAWREFPVSYLYTTQDRVVPVEYQRSMVEEMRREGAKVRTYEVESGHCPNFTNARMVVGYVEEILGY